MNEFEDLPIGLNNLFGFGLLSELSDMLENNDFKLISEEPSDSGSKELLDLLEPPAINYQKKWQEAEGRYKDVTTQLDLLRSRFKKVREAVLQEARNNAIRFRVQAEENDRHLRSQAEGHKNCHKAWNKEIEKNSLQLSEYVPAMDGINNGLTSLISEIQNGKSKIKKSAIAEKLLEILDIVVDSQNLAKWQVERINDNQLPQPEPNKNVRAAAASAAAESSQTE